MTADSEDGREERAAPAQPAVIDANRPACMRTRLGAVGTSVTIIGAAGSTAAISAIFGNLQVADVMFLEVVGLARSQMMLVVLPWPVSSGVGGLGRWTGLEIGALAIPDLEPVRLTVIGLPIASVVLVLLLEDAAASQMPVVIMVVVVAIVIEGLLSTVVAPVADS